MISDTGLALIKRFEGCKLTAYQDSVGVWTIGVGSTEGVTEGMTITQDEADERLRKDCDTAERRMSKFVSTDLPQAARDALISMTFNLGLRCWVNSDGSSTGLRRALAAGRFGDVPDEMRKWTRANGVVLPGLVARREAEAELFRSAFT